MTIKNWFVRNEAINNKAQGCLAYAHYLQDPNHPNHKDKTTIKILHNSPVNTALLAIKEAYELDQANRKKGKGGRSISSFMQSYVFSLPESIDLNEEEWKRVAKDIIVELSQRLEIDPKLLLKNSSIVLHKQSNTHLNFLISRSIEGKSYQQVLTRPSATNLLKTVFNASVLRCGYDFADYIPKRKLNKKLKRWQELGEKERYVSLKQVELKKVEKKIKVANNQLAKLKIAIQCNNNKDINRQSNRLNKTIEKMDPIDDAVNKQLELLRGELDKLEPEMKKNILNIKKIKIKRQ
ncbi:hypothetical protein [Vibrio vulnificus]|uniref:hypothetical protein n=1 Tax=Vibrio vulnificus TaxID=672 RepID=UPI00215CFD7B|nr:hypothetical protein [Vibrio vulnificus]MCR9500679.1 hypothetical protein [Vibrio vulnificus]